MHYVLAREHTVSSLEKEMSLGSCSPSRGLTISPTSVRPKPDVQDGYNWWYIPAKCHLFGKPLSKLSIGTYMELYREVGTSFEANTPSPPPTASFSTTIEDLERERTKIQVISTQWQESAAKERELRQGLEAKNQEIQLALSKTLRQMDRLTSKNNRLQDQIVYLQRKLRHSQQRTRKAFRALRELGQIVQKERDEDSEHEWKDSIGRRPKQD